MCVGGLPVCIFRGSLLCRAKTHGEGEGRRDMIFIVPHFVSPGIVIGR